MSGGNVPCFKQRLERRSCSLSIHSWNGITNAEAKCGDAARDPEARAQDCGAWASEVFAARRAHAPRPVSRVLTHVGIARYFEYLQLIQLVEREVALVATLTRAVPAACHHPRDATPLGHVLEGMPVVVLRAALRL